MNKSAILPVIVLISFSAISSSFAQVALWGTTSRGGDHGLGTIYKTNYNGENQQVIHSFSSPYQGSSPQGDLIQATNGKLYGYNSSGGKCGEGNMFEYDIVTGVYTILFDFDFYTTGGGMGGRLLQAANGKLYGMTFYGGPANAGAIFEYDLIAQSFSVISDFSGLDFKCVKAGGLIQATNGKLYGLGDGGANDFGVIFELDLAVGTPVKIYDFDISGNDGIEPWGALIQATNGKLYGMASSGGTNYLGVVFEYDISTSTFTTKINLSNATGRYPYSSLMQASSGLIYGLTNEGGTGTQNGTLFEFDPVANTLAPVINFNGTVGAHPYYGVVCEAPNGNLYGMAFDGGNDFMGTLFEYNPVTQIASAKVSFDGENGGYPLGSLTLASNGKLYGLTEMGVGSSPGNLFEYDYISDSLTPLVDMNLAPEGGFPAGGLTMALNGKLYGITQTGGAYDMGVIYEIDPSNGAVDSVASFNATNGGFLIEPGFLKMELCAASNGKLYGVNSRGGDNLSGALYEYDPVTMTITKKVDFVSATMGNRPEMGLIQASDGKLYGTASQGGTNNQGTLFSYDIAGNTLTKHFDFAVATGSNPGSTLTEIAPGRIYGVTRNGSANGRGAIYRFDVASNSTTTLADFSISTGSGLGTLLHASNGIVYGMMTRDGVNSQGTIYTFDTTTNIITKLIDFDGSNSTTNFTPGRLTEVQGGKLFAMRELAGIDFQGDLFEFDIATNTYTRKITFGCGTGYRPSTTSVISVNTESGSLVWPGDCNFDMQANNTDFLMLGLANGTAGTVRPGASNNWTGQPAAAWTSTFNNSVNYKHADSNGDGTVNMNDSVAINLNYGMTHPFRYSNPVTSLAVADFKLIASSNAIAPGSAVEFDIYIADASAPLDSLYGIAFTLEFDPALVDASQTAISWSPSVLGTVGTNMESLVKYFPGSGRIETAICRTDHNNAANLSGVIGRLHLVASASVNVLSNLTVLPTGISGIITSEQTLTFNPIADSVIIDPALIGISEINNGQGIYVYPNPATTKVFIGQSYNIPLKIIITDSKGSIVYKGTTSLQETEINVDSFNDGIYFINIVSANGVTNRKLFVNRMRE